MNNKTKSFFKRHVKKFNMLLVGILLAHFGYAQSGMKVTGVITDGKDLTPLIGATIYEQGTSNGTITDIDGKYAITLQSEEAVLVVNYVGYDEALIAVNGVSTQDLQMMTGKALDEVVVVGYGQLKKRDITGSVGSVDAETLVQRGGTNPLEGLQGNVAGVQISSATGRIGDGFNIVIRGKNSMNADSKPLYIVDGVPTDGIDFLNPQDIDRIDILKDASSTAIYGSRGSNGVVIVTTKSGSTAGSGIQTKGVNVSFDTYFGIKKVARLPEMMSPEKWWYYHQSAYLATTTPDPVTGTVTPELLENSVVGSRNSLLKERALANEGFDWYDAVLKDGTQNNNYLNIAGLSENGMSYNLGLGFQNETGNVENEDLKKYTVKLGLNHNISDKVVAGANITLAKTNENYGSDLAMREAFRLSPFMTPYDIDGVTLYPLPGKLVDENGDFIIDKTSTYNPILEIQNSVDERKRTNAVGSVFLGYEPIKGLAFRTTFSPGYNEWTRGKSWSPMTNTGVSNNNLSSSELENFENFNFTWDNQVNYDKNFGDHSLNLLGLQSIYSSTTERSFISSRNQPFYTEYFNVGSGDPSTYNLSSGYTEQSLASFAVRVNYAYKNKYLLTLSNRWDGSSLLADGNKWDNFPSAAFAWRISEEDFMSSANAISSLKLRVSYGFTGNNIISPYSTQNALNTQTYYDYNGTGAAGWLPSQLANTALGWEKTREANFGLDFGFMNDRFYGSVDVYDRLSDDLLLAQQLPRESGWSSINANVGSVSNKGVELGLNARILNTDKLYWTAGLTFNRNVNQIVSIYGQDEVDDVGNGFFIGESVDAQYNYEFDGIWQANEAELAETFNQTEGQGKVKDQNGDGVISPDDDRVVLGSADPSWAGGFNTRLQMGNLDLSVALISSQGQFLYSPFHANFTNTEDRGRQKADIDWYIPANDAGLEPQYSNSYPQPRNMGTYWRNDGVGYYREVSFTKIKNITVGYNLGNVLESSLGLRSARLYFNVLNPFVITDYDGYDPEWADADLGIGRVSSITYQIGLNTKF